MKKDPIEELENLSISEWNIKALSAVKDDLDKLDDSQRILTFKAIRKVSGNPLPISEGGYGKPLGNRSQNKLAGFLKIKLKKAGIRIVYTLKREQNKMLIIVIGIREDEEVYNIAEQRKRELD